MGKLWQDVKAFVERHLKRFTIDFWIWVAAACTLAFIVFLLGLKIFFAGAGLTRQALESGQRVTISIATGDVEGNARHTQQAKKKAPAKVIANANANANADAFATPVISKEGLAPAPLATISEESDTGLLPILGSDGTVPWKYYARPYTSETKRPLVAVVLTNLGLSKPLTEDVLKLPHGITLSFSPYASDTKTWARMAREEGFESMIDLPMQAQDYPLSDPGPHGLLENLTPAESRTRLDWVLSRFPGFVGVLAPIDEKLTSNPTAMRPTFVELAARGVLFLYMKTPQNASLATAVNSRTLYTLGIDMVIDSEIAQTPIEKQLQNLVALAKKNGTAIGIAHSYPPTIDALANWADTLAEQGVDLVPVSAVAKRVLP